MAWGRYDRPVPPDGSRASGSPAVLATSCGRSTGPQRHLADATPYWAVDLVDDHSRYCPNLLVGPALTGQLAWATLRGAVASYGLPAQRLSNNGLCFTGRLHAMIVSFERHPTGLD